jgi:hypothetical protein
LNTSGIEEVDGAFAQKITEGQQDQDGKEAKKFS